jgi:hypothetical protein
MASSVGRAHREGARLSPRRSRARSPVGRRSVALGPLRRGFLAASIAASVCLPVAQAWGARLVLCPVPPGQEIASAPDRFVYQDAGGRSFALSVSDAAASQACAAVMLPIAAKEVRWLGLIARGPTPRSIALQGEERGGAFEAAGAEVGSAASPRDDNPATMLATPVRTELLPHLCARPFGVEERAEVERSADRLTLACRPGHRPAHRRSHRREFRLSPDQQCLADYRQLALSARRQGLGRDGAHRLPARLSHRFDLLRVTGRRAALAMAAPSLSPRRINALRA